MQVNKTAFIVIIALTLTLPILGSSNTFLTGGDVLSVDQVEPILEISGLIENPLRLTINDLASMPKTTVQATIYCVDFPNQIVTSGNWTGVQLALLLERAGISQSATKVAFFASDGYSTDLVLEIANNPDVIIAYEKDGAPLSERLRLVVPGRWGYKWISHLNRIEIVNFDFKGKWESLGYSDFGNETGAGRPNIPSGITSPNLATPKSNATEFLPTDFPSSNQSTALPPEKTRDLMPETKELESAEPFPLTFVAFIFAALSAIAGTLLLAYRKKR